MPCLKVKRTFSNYLKKALRKLNLVRYNKSIIITEYQKGVAVLLDVFEYEAMQEKLELLMDMQTSLSQLENGQWVAHEDAKEKILKRIQQ